MKSILAMALLICTASAALAVSATTPPTISTTTSSPTSPTPPSTTSATSTSTTTATPTSGAGTLIQSTDEAGLTYPLWVQSDTTGLVWNNGSTGSTYGRMIRLQDLALGGSTTGFYDLGIDHAGNFFVTIQANPTKSFLIAPGGGATFTSTLRVDNSVSTGGNVSVGGSLNVSGQVSINNLPVAPAGAKHLMVDSAGNLYVEP